MNKSVNSRIIGPFPPLTGEQRAASLRRAMAESAPADDIWLFAYGSLMWNPCFEFDRDLSGAVEGYRREFSIWTAHARGTPERPGLGLALEPGAGRCEGRVFRLSRARRDSGLEAIWDREMATGIYRPRWLAVTTGDGDRRALAFVPDPAHAQYAGAFTPHETADIIAGATGKFGSCADYLADTVAALSRLGIDEPGLSVLLSLVRERLSGDA